MRKEQQRQNVMNLPQPPIPNLPMSLDREGSRIGNEVEARRRWRWGCSEVEEDVSVFVFVSHHPTLFLISNKSNYFSLSESVLLVTVTGE